ncbi:thiamine transporter 2 [Amia ocellicauda]|uniref:thiamine transporter 2 n=1 Tax=Amia ocellicauda TaxID=2972642 RepID=UPI00346433D8
MKSWKRVRGTGWVYPTVVLSFYGFLANFRPAEPFLTPYLVGPYKNISEHEVTNVLFPIWTYSYLVILLPVFLLTDFLRYKPVIVFQGVCLVSNWSLLCFAQGLPAMKYLQFNFAMVTATEVAYFSYIYSVVSSDHYQKVTSYLRAVTLVGYTLGSTLGQILVSVASLPYFYLNAANLATASMAFLCSFFLPMPRGGMFFKRESRVLNLKQDHNLRSNSIDVKMPSSPSLDVVPHTEREDTEELGLSRESVRRAIGLLWQSFRETYSSKKLIYWSLWWALATCGYYQIFNYIQLLWNHIEPSGDSMVYNGAVEAVTTLVGAIAAFSVSHVKLDWDLWGELALGVFSALSAGAVYMMGFTRNIWVCYTGYVTFKASYMLLITITTFQIAANLSMECYALTFGMNTFVAILLQTVVTAIVVDESGLGLDIVTQFIVYGSYYVAISVLFVTRGLYTRCSASRRSSVQVLCSSKL